jgi:hypothetical protein
MNPIATNELLDELFHIDAHLRRHKSARLFNSTIDHLLMKKWLVRYGSSVFITQLCRAQIKKAISGD